MTTSRVQILLEAKNQASKALKQVSSDLGGLDKAAKGLPALLASIGGGFAAMQAGRFAIQMAQLNTQIERTGFAFEHFSGGSGQAAVNLRAVQRAAGGAISEFQAMGLATTAMTQGLASNAQELERITKIARGITAVSPVINDMESAFSQLGLTIANQSYMRLDQLGTSAGEVKAKIDELTAANENLTEAQAFETALLDTLEAKFNSLTDAAVNQASGLESLTAAWQDYVQKGVGLAGVVDDVAGGWAIVLRGMTLLSERADILGQDYDSLTAKQKRYYDALAGLDLQTQGLLGSGDPTTVAGVQQIIDGFNQATAAVERLASGIAEGPITQMDHLRQLGTEMAEAITGPLEDWSPENLWGNIAEAPDTTSWRDVGDLVRQLASDFENTAIQSEIMGGRWQNAGATGAKMAQEFQGKLADVVMKMQDAGMTAEEVEAAVFDVARQLQAAALAGTTAGESIKGGMLQAAVGASILSNNLADALSKLGAMGGALSNAKTAFGEMFGTAGTSKLGAINDSLSEAGEIGYELERIYSPSGGIASGISSLASKVQGLFGIGPVAGVDANDLLPREDAVNENARRLADIAVNGLKGQNWLGEFAAEVPDIFAQISEAGDPQMAAAQLLRDFQDGLLNGTDVLIDREAAKEKVRRMIMGEQSTAELANSIAQELQTEMGVAMGAAQGAAAAVLGGGGTGTGEAIIAEVRAAEARIKSAGADAGRQWGQFFLNTVGDGVPGELVQMLATLVTPAVQGNLNTQASRAGAAP